MASGTATIAQVVPGEKRSADSTDESDGDANSALHPTPAKKPKQDEGLYF